MESINKKDEDGRTELHNAKGPISHLLDEGADPNVQDESGWTPLMCAASSGDFDKVRTLLCSSSIDVNLRNEQGNTALHYTASKGRNDIITLLLQRDDVQLNLQDYNSKFTPLMRAVVANQQVCADRLIQSGCKLNLRDCEGNTALHLAVEQNNLDIALLLLSGGAKHDIENRFNQTPLDNASPMMRHRLEEEL